MPWIPDHKPQRTTARRLHDHQKKQDHALVHLSDELVDVVFPVTEVTAKDIVAEFSCPPTASGVGELERPQEI